MSGTDKTSWPKFSPETLERLFDAVNVDDVVDTAVTLPDAIALACSEDSMRRCFALCLQFWEDGVKRADLLRLVGKLLWNKGLSADERLQYKYIRARYKHLRFAQKLYGERHETDYLFGLMTRILGQLQDAFRSGQRSAIIRNGLALRLLLAKPVWARIWRDIRHTSLDSAPGFLMYRQTQMHRLKNALGLLNFTGREFHMVRKIVSMQVSYYDTLRSLDPAEDDYYKMSRFLAAINGLMGSRHDEMVADSLLGRRDYGSSAPLNQETRWRLETLVANYPL